MKKKFLQVLALVCMSLMGQAQKLDSFTTTLQAGNYLSINLKKAFTEAEAKANKSAVDMALLGTKNGSKQRMEWYNMSGKDGNIPADLKGTSTLINTISFDKEQFDKCKTNQDLKRMTGHLTNNSFSHFATVSDDLVKGITYHCFIIQKENGKRALLWLEAVNNNTYKVIVKVEI